MTTLHDRVRTYLLANAGVTSSPCGTRVNVDNWLPDGYKIVDGAALVFAPRGGPGSTLYAMEDQTMVFRGFAETVADAFSIDDAVFEAFRLTHNPANTTGFYAKDTVSPILSREPGGLYVVSSSFAIAAVIS